MGKFSWFIFLLSMLFLSSFTQIIMLLSYFNMLVKNLPMVEVEEVEEVVVDGDGDVVDVDR